jgi:hypothetical protein
VASENVAKIDGILSALSPEQRQKPQLETVDGEERLTHWSIMLAARKHG